ncbi:hypothetical protein [Pedobacter mendelii]|nr:hypothetical protein [Pedobacter mendelii]
MDVNEKIFELFDHIDQYALENDTVLLKELTHLDNEWDKLPEDN